MASFLSHISSILHLSYLFGREKNTSDSKDNQEYETVDTDEYFYIEDHTDKCCSITIHFLDEYAYGIMKNILFEYYDKSQFQDKGKCGLLDRELYNGRNLLIHVYDSTNRMHIQGGACSEWYYELFPLFKEDFCEAIKSNKFIHVISNPRGNEETRNDEQTCVKDINSLTKSSSHASLQLPLPLHCSTPIKQTVLNQSDVECLFTQLRVMEERINSLQVSSTNAKPTCDTRSIHTQTDRPSLTISTGVHVHNIQPTHQGQDKTKQTHSPVHKVPINPKELKIEKEKPINQDNHQTQHDTSILKNQLKGTLIIGSSILQRITPRGLKENVTVKCIKGGIIPTIYKQLSYYHLPDFKDIIILVGGNDMSQGRNLHRIEQDIIKVIDYIKGASPSTNILLSRVLPRCDVDVAPINAIYEKVCKNSRISFIKYRQIFSYDWNMYWEDGKHLSDLGTAELVKTFNNYVDILKPSKRVKTPIFNCGETGHVSKSCKLPPDVHCYSCGVRAHKAKNCYHNSSYGSMYDQ
ncbi:hypothetical protein SNE40_022159 [Patella caerulea]|uniref:CCHC-type domain-containing protein n=1 Tax=Patella caerulea TaxID=87958 RepID=A0AAN8G7F0_PATCE